MQSWLAYRVLASEESLAWQTRFEHPYSHDGVYPHRKLPPLDPAAHARLPSVLCRSRRSGHIASNSSRRAPGTSVVRDALSRPRYCRFARARVVSRCAWEATTFTGHVRDGVAGGRRFDTAGALAQPVRGTRTDIT